MWEVKLTKSAEKDLANLKAAGLSKKAKLLVDVLENNPYQNPPPYEKLIGNLAGKYSRRINIQHRMIYKVLDNEKIVIISSMWSHYE